MKKIAILGFGTVGSGVAEILTENKSVISKKIGEEIEIKYILDLRDFPSSPFKSKIIKDYDVILNDKEVDIVCEMLGGLHPAYDFSKSAILSGKSVVTSNKAVVAEYGAELLDLALKNNVRYLFEASVGGGIPIIRPMQNDLNANNITSIDGILNGTTNFILTNMIQNSEKFEDVLKLAQEKGYAEKDPTADVDGFDAARKIVILSAIAFGKILDFNKIYTKGIRDISNDDVNIAKQLDCSIKLIASSTKIDNKILSFVAPAFVKNGNPLSHIDGVYNGILVTADMLDKVLFYGQGAGKLPTASAVVSDILDIVSNKGKKNSLQFNKPSEFDYAPIDNYIGDFAVVSNGKYEIFNNIKFGELKKKVSEKSKIYRII